MFIKIWTAYAELTVQQTCGVQQMKTLDEHMRSVRLIRYKITFAAVSKRTSVLICCAWCLVLMSSKCMKAAPVDAKHVLRCCSTQIWCIPLKYIPNANLPVRRICFEGMNWNIDDILYIPSAPDTKNISMVDLF